MKLSIVIVNYNVKYFLEQALLSTERAIQATEKHYGPGCCEVFVVDNHSADGSVEMVAQKFPWAKLIANEKNVGFSRANNQAIRLSNAEHVLLLNPDTVLQEDSLLLPLQHMDAHPDTGALGVKMVDGQGVYLPESKRGLPTPQVALYKITGIYKLFPTSARFNRYYMGHLSPDEVNEVDVLAGAYMLLRRKAFETAGLLDEQFFMYGEDIDLSYRIQKAGYKVVYFPKTRIIHYKGESTKKGSLNYVKVFYQAMIIFARKHFSKGQAGVYEKAIRLAIWSRAAVALAGRLAKALALPLLDALLIYLLLRVFVGYWEENHKYVAGGSYPPLLKQFFLPLYVLVWIAGLALAGAYSKNRTLRNDIQGAVGGTVALGFIYAFLPEQYHYSRAIILAGALIALFVAAINHEAVFRLLGRKRQKGSKKVIIVGDEAEFERVSHLLKQVNMQFDIVGRIDPNEHASASAPSVVGPLGRLAELVDLYKVDEVIFCAANMQAADIIGTMSSVPAGKVDFKIVPQSSMFVIGSSSKGQPGDYYSFEIALRISNPRAHASKRALDVAVAVVGMALFPFCFFLFRHPGQLFRNLWNVLTGNIHLAGYNSLTGRPVQLPPLKPSLLTYFDVYRKAKLEPDIIARLEYQYAKDYSLGKDFFIILRAWRYLDKPIQPIG